MSRTRHEEYQYLDLLKDILKNGVKKIDRGTNVTLYSVFGRQIRFDLSKGFPLLTTKKVYWKGMLHELYWFFSGQTNIKYLVDNNVHIWDDYPYKIYRKSQESRVKSQGKKQSRLSTLATRFLTKEEFIERIRTDEKFAEKWGNLPRIYGEMWRRWPTRTKRTIDQLEWIVQELKDDPDAKNLIVNSWNPEYLYTMATKEDTSYFPICHNMFQINQRGGKLSLQLYHRSCDVFLGVPFNIASYALLTLILAKITGYEPGEFIHVFGDVHIYENHINQVKEQIKRKPRPFPKIKLDPGLQTIEDFRPELVTLEDYDPHPTIQAELTVAGGYYEKPKFLGCQPKSTPRVSRPIISAIVAIDENRGIGKNNKLLFYIKEDFDRMHKIIAGHPLVMGRKTHESIGRVLPTCLNIVITRDPEYKKKHTEGCIVCPSLEEALKKAKKENHGGEIFIFGGGEIYKQAMPIIQRLYLTIVKGGFGADTFFPDYSDFKKVVFESEGKEADGFKYKFLELER